jgi:pimeloyl-ACP methyl ester carboxylesterase
MTKGRKLVVAAAAWFVWRHLGPELPPRVRGAQEHPMPIPGRTVMVGEHEYFVREAGPVDALPLVLIHGWALDSVGIWNKVMAPLAERHRVFAIDHRNHGKSDRIRGRYSIEDAADEVAGVMDAIGVPRAPVVGYSMGGMITQALALRHPARVERMVLVATAAYAFPTRRALTLLAFALAKALGIFHPDLRARIAYHYLLGVGAVDRRHARWMWDSLVGHDMYLYYQAGLAVWRFDSRGWLPRLGTPALVVIPTEDQMMPTGSQRHLAELLTAGRAVDLVGARHEAGLTHADDLVEAIESFLAEDPGG